VLFAEQGFDVQALHIGTYLRARTGCAETHNPNAYTLLGRAMVSPRERGAANAS